MKRYTLVIITVLLSLLTVQAALAIPNFRICVPLLSGYTSGYKIKLGPVLESKMKSALDTETLNANVLVYYPYNYNSSSPERTSRPYVINKLKEMGVESVTEVEGSVENKNLVGGEGRLNITAKKSILKKVAAIPEVFSILDRTEKWPRPNPEIDYVVVIKERTPQEVESVKDLLEASQNFGVVIRRGPIDEADMSIFNISADTSFIEQLKKIKGVYVEHSAKRTHANDGLSHFGEYDVFISGQTWDEFNSIKEILKLGQKSGFILRLLNLTKSEEEEFSEDAEPTKTFLPLIIAFHVTADQGFMKKLVQIAGVAIVEVDDQEPENLSQSLSLELKN